MTLVANFFSKLIKAIPVLALKLGTILVLIFTIGMVAGYAILAANITPAVFIIPIIAMFIMWYKLDEGVFVLILLTLLVIFFPEFLNSLLSFLG